MTRKKESVRGCGGGCTLEEAISRVVEHVRKGLLVGAADHEGEQTSHHANPEVLCRGEPKHRQPPKKYVAKGPSPKSGDHRLRSI
eukprot:7546433-Pyramimonas_sp.AAC.2